MAFLCTQADELSGQGLRSGDLDAVIITGDAYVDHSSFGAAIIGKVLAARGYKVGLLARPDPDDVLAFRLLGRPRLAFLVTAGAVDSMVSNYTANKKPRSEDDYAPGGDKSLCLRGDGSIGPGIRNRPNARPDRAVIVYATMCRQAFKGVPVVIGGIEASLRRLSHYDYWSDTVRKSILLDSKADILVYGMGERQIVEIMERLSSHAAGRTEKAGQGHATAASQNGKPDLSGIRGTVWTHHIGTAPVESIRAQIPDAVILPDFASLDGSTPEAKKTYAESFATQYRNAEPLSAHTLIEPYGDRVVIQERPALPLSQEEMDAVYALPFERQWHPSYEQFGGIPALSEVKFSLTSSRGCFGACSFCALTFHQGRNISSRSRESICEEARQLVALPDFKGYIHDVGGPTANFRVPACDKMAKTGACTNRHCLSPEPCPHLKPDHRDYVALLRELRAIPGVKKVFVRSGVRFDYAMLDSDDTFLRELVEHHISGQLKVAPEHVNSKVLTLMCKAPHRSFEAFSEKYVALNREMRKKQYLIPYFISGHPGAGLQAALELALYLKKTGFVPDQVQDFYPTPGTLATAMWWCEFNPLDGEPVYVAKGARERAEQRALLQFNKPQNAALVRETLRAMGRDDLIGSGPYCLVSRGRDSR
ncbi:MAG: YgiQ family radical SAM protein [Spirochaetaceae bacterium]|nr:YgiQ family radical SAM protein [Spirochaetaceae bacterium]